MIRKTMQRFAGFRKRTWVILGIVTVLVLGGGTTAVVWGVTRPSGASSEPVTQTVAASLETLEKSVEATGTLTPKVQEEVSFAASGTVQRVEVEAGDTVKKGQKLASVDSLQADANLLQAKADLADAEAQLASEEASADGTTASDARIAANEAAVEVAEQSVADAKTAVKGVTLVAPVAGLVTSVGIEVGDAVTGTSGSSASSSSGGSAGGMGESTAGASTSTTASTSQFTIVSTDSWTVSVSLGETEVGLISVDDQVELETSDGVSLFGVVTEIGKLPSTSSDTAQYPVTIDITGDAEGVFDGTSVTATIIYERRPEVLTVPSSAVTTAEDGTTTVTVVDSDGAESERQVTVGETVNNLAEVTDGLEEGEQVLVVVFTPGEGNTAAQGGAGEAGGEMPDFSGGEMPDFAGGAGGAGGGPGGGQMPGSNTQGGGQ